MATPGVEGYVAEDKHSYWDTVASSKSRAPHFAEGVHDDPVHALVQQVYDEFHSTCACVIAYFINLRRRRIWNLEFRSIIEMSHVVRAFTDRERANHKTRLRALASVARPLDKLPSNVDPEGAAAKCFEGYCLKTQFVLMFSVPFTPREIKQQNLRKGARRRLTLTLTTPPLAHYWDTELHAYLPDETRQDIENVVLACRGLPLDMYEENPFASMDPKIFERIFGFMVTPVSRKGTCLSKRGKIKLG